MKKLILILSCLFFLWPIFARADENVEDMQAHLEELKAKLDQKKSGLTELEKEAGIDSQDETDTSPLPTQITTEPAQPESQNYKGKILSIKTEEKSETESDPYANELIPNKDTPGATPVKYTQQTLEIKLLNKDKKGEIISLANDLRGNPYRFDLKAGDKVFINSLQYSDQPLQYIIKDFYHLDWLGIWAGIFMLAIIVLGRKKGAFALLSLGLSIAAIFFVLFPLIKKGYNPILLTLAIASVITILVLPIITGWSRKTLVAVFGTLSGIAIATLLALLMGWLTKTTGLGEETTRLISASFPDLNFRYIFSSGIIIGALGAVMDTAVSIASSQQEVKTNKPAISRPKLMRSGLNVGRDIMGSMINTLIFAYIGASFALVLMFTESGVSIWEILNLGFISEEITRSLVGALGLLATIPLTALFGGFIYSKKEKDDGENNKGEA